MFGDIWLLSTYFCRVPVQTYVHKIAVLADAVSGCLHAGTDDWREIILRKIRHVIQAVLTRRRKYFMFFTVGTKTFEAHVFLNLTSLDSRKEMWHGHVKILIIVKHHLKFLHYLIRQTCQGYLNLHRFFFSPYKNKKRLIFDFFQVIVNLNQATFTLDRKTVNVNTNLWRNKI